MANARRAAAPAVTAVIAAAAARAAYTALTRSPPGGAERWTRTNHRGEPVTLLEGPAAALAGAVAATAAAGVPARSRAALATAAAGAAAFGGYDDIAGSGDRRGFRGHLGALAHGEVTTGAVKLGGIGVTGVAAAALTGGPAVDVAINSALIAGSANLLNLFDLRPGRALKVVMAAGVPLGVGQLAACSARSSRRSSCGGLWPCRAPRPGLASCGRGGCRGAARGGRGAAARGPGGAGHARGRRRQRARCHARRGRGWQPVPPVPARHSRRGHRADRGQRGRQLHQGHPADAAAALAGHAGPQARPRGPVVRPRRGGCPHGDRPSGAAVPAQGGGPRATSPEGTGHNAMAAPHSP